MENGKKLYDPIELSFYKQTYYFTQLADYFYYTETIDYNKIESNSKKVSEYPFGVSFVNPYNTKIKHALFVRFKDNKLTSQNEGESEKIVTNYEDLDSDGYIDTEKIIQTKEKKYDDVNNSFLFNFE